MIKTRGTDMAKVMVNEPLPDASMEISCDGLTVIVCEVPGETCTLICRLK